MGYQLHLQGYLPLPLWRTQPGWKPVQLLKSRLDKPGTMEKIHHSLWGLLLLCLGYTCRVPEAGIKTPEPQPPTQLLPEKTNSSQIAYVPNRETGKDSTAKLKDTVAKLKDTKEKLKPQAPPTLNPKPQTPNSSPSITTAYLSQLGVREATGHNDGKQVEKYLRAVGLGKGYPWCAAFVRWCYDTAGIKTKINGAAASAHNPNNLVYYKSKQHQEPQPGDVFTLWYTQLNRIGHTGFYHKTVNSTIYESIEGNTNEAGSREGDGVYKKYRSLRATYSISRWEK